MELRPYQQQAKDAIFSEWENGIKKTLLVLPTGCGKTIVFAKVAEECVKGGSRVLILAHRGELLDQAADKIGKSTGLGCATEKAEQTCLGSWFRIVVGSVQSMMREKRLNQFPNDYFNTIIIDEAHHCISDSYQKVLRHFPDAEVLGVTATPDRGDMQNLGTVFESLAYEYTLPKAIKEGYLSPIKAVTIPLKIDMSAVGVQAGDFKSGDIATALDPYLESIAEEMEKYCSNKKTVVFLPLVKTSQKFRDILNNHTYEQLEEIAGARVERSERTALANFFRNQGMTESEVTQAINNFKAERAANQPNATKLQKDLDDALAKVQQMENEKTLSGKGVRSEDLDYVMFKVSKLVDDKTTFEKAADKFLKENPKFTGSAGSYRISTSSGNSSEGSGGNMNASINDRIRAAARR